MHPSDRVLLLLAALAWTVLTVEPSPRVSVVPAEFLLPALAFTCARWSVKCLRAWLACRSL